MIDDFWDSSYNELLTMKLRLQLLVLLQLLGWRLPVLLGFKHSRIIFSAGGWKYWQKSSWISQHCQTPQDNIMKDNGGDITTAPKIRRIKKNKYARFSQAPRLDPVEQTKENVAKQEATKENMRRQQLQRGTSTPQVNVYPLYGFYVTTFTVS